MPPAHPTSIETNHIDANGARLFVQSAGSGRPLVFLHASIADSRMWAGQVRAFSPGWRAIAYDLRGFGRSAAPPDPFAHYQDLYSLLSRLRLRQPAVLVGSSLGGATALNFTLQHPEMVAALALSGSGLDGYTFQDGHTTAQWPSIEAALEKARFGEAARLETRLWLRQPQASSPEVDTLVQEMLRQVYTLPQPGEAQTLPRPAIQRLGEISVPTLVMVGAQDVPDMHAIARLLREGIRGARSAVIPGAAHLPNLEQPAAFNRVLSSFLASLG